MGGALRMLWHWQASKPELQGLALPFFADPTAPRLEAKSP